MAKALFEKEYDGEELADVGRDVSEGLNSTFNHRMIGIPTDEHGFPTGSFRVLIEWIPPARVK